MDGLKNLLGSEHGIFGVLLIIGATTLAGIGVMTVADWKSFSEVIFGAFGATHIGVSVADAFTSKAVADKAKTETKSP